MILGLRAFYPCARIGAQEDGEMRDEDVEE
jgi:hypothetical protein